MQIEATKETTDESGWIAAGQAWGHAATDWAYRFEPHARDATDSLFQRLEVGPGTSLADVACGSGYATAQAQRMGATVTGLDASADLIDIARRRTDEAEFLVGDMFALPWDNDQFDVVTSINGIWGGCDGAVAEAARVLRPGGRIGITFWGRAANLDLRDFFMTLGSCLPELAEEMIATASIGAPGVAEAMLLDAGFGSIERYEAHSVLELVDEDVAWRTIRSPGLVTPALEALGDDETRRRLLPTLAPFRADDGSYRLVSELTCMTAVLQP